MQLPAPPVTTVNQGTLPRDANQSPNRPGYVLPNGAEKPTALFDR